MIALLAILAAAPPAPGEPLRRVTVCYADGGGCSGVSPGLTDTQLRASAVPVSGTLTCNAGTGTLAVSLASAPSTPVTGTFWQTTQPVSGTFWQATQPVSGTVTTTPPSNATTNVTQVGGTDVAKGLGAATAGTLRVAVASDTVHGVTGTFWQATQPVSGTFWQATQPISGTVTANAGTGTMAVSGPVTDAQLRATPINVYEGSGTRWSCFVQAVTATTQCRAAPAGGIRAYVTGLSCSNGAATVQTVDVVFGTGSNCATGTTALTHKYQLGTNATTTSPFLVSVPFVTPLVPTAANAICVRPSAATAFGCTLTGYDAT